MNRVLVKPFYDQLDFCVSTKCQQLTFHEISDLLCENNEL